MLQDEFINRTKLVIFIAALMSALLVAALVQVTLERRTCAKACKAVGYADMRFTPKRRFEGAQCHCLTKEEAAQTSRVPKGTQIQLPAK